MKLSPLFHLKRIISYKKKYNIESGAEDFLVPLKMLEIWDPETFVLFKKKLH